MKIATCTISSNNYLNYSGNLLNSLKDCGDQSDRFILIADQITEEIKANTINATVVSIADLEIPRLRELAFKYNIVEFNTALKPFFLRWLLAKGYDAVVYLDPDIMVFCALDELYDEFNRASILITPHVLLDTSGGILSDTAFSCNGIFNLGFIGVKNDQNGLNALKWWSAKLLDYCYLDYVRGMATDQKWVDFFPALFDGVSVIKHPGCNMALWNLHERYVESRGTEWIVNGSHRLLFYHFSGYKIDNPGYLLGSMKVPVYSRPDLQPLYELYQKSVEAGKWSKPAYLFATYENGMDISPAHRAIFSVYSRNFADPFSVGPDSFYLWLRGRGLLRPSGRSQAPNLDLIGLLSTALGPAPVEPAVAPLVIKSGRRAETAFLLFLARIIGPDRFFRLLGSLAATGDIKHFAQFIA